ncbi:ATP-binding cassette domain-containing protein [Puteibacter caeruleilacunae]|nr:ATP-binding cassette domain-containing protein [Puteibacter caeruleilacunae]
MQQHTHWAIYGSGLSMESPFIKKLLRGNAPEPFLLLEGKKGVLFSNHTLNRFIKEEAIHDDYTLTEGEHRSIRTFSSGEQKKALLNHLLSKNPDFLILDNAFDILDKASQKLLKGRLTELSQQMPIIQIFRRKENVLPFVDKIVRFEDDKIIFTGTTNEYQALYQQTKSFSLNGNIPPALVDFDPMDDPLIAFKNVTVSYDDRCILNNINWEINQGDFWQLMGPNGSGKTTLLTMITGDNPKAYGKDITLFGKKKGSGESVWDIKKKIGYVTPAMTTLFRGRHTVESMVISGLHDSIGLYNKPSFMERDLAAKWIELIGMTDIKDKWFSHLSEGQQCMVLIARSMIKHPPLLILDEPTHGLDDYFVSILIELVNKIAAESRTTIIYVSHKDEKGLEPEITFELIPDKSGSTGRIKQ